MSVYTFEKSFLQRLEEIKLILEETGSIREQFKDFLETSIEPAGYSAIWRLSRATAEDLNVKYPTEVFGVVQNTDFEDLSVSFNVMCVQDETVHLPETCRVKLEELYPTVEQENSALQENVDSTADCIDRYRFFFNYIFLPWDDDESNWRGKLLLPRTKLFFDLTNKKLSKGLSSHIRSIIAEAKYIQNKQENLENSFDEDSSVEIDISHGESKDKARKLLELHFRLNKIKHEIDILVNPEMREIYEEVKFPHHQLSKDGEKKVFAVTKAGTLSEQIQLIQELKHKVTDDATIHWLSLHDAISASSASSEIYIPAGLHTINFLEYLNGDILLCGLNSISKDTLQVEQTQRYATVSSIDSGSMLFAVDGKLRLQDLIIDCKNVKTGFLVKDGELTVKNCVIFGCKESSVSEAFTISGTSEVLIENCIISGFATAMTINDTAQVIVRNSIVKDCTIGVHMLDDDGKLSLENSSILNCDESGILKYSSLNDGVQSKSLDWNNKTEAETFNISFAGNNKFDENKHGNITISSKFPSVIPIKPVEDDITMEM